MKYFFIQYSSLQFLSIFLVVFQSIGIRFVAGQGWIISLILILLNFRGIRMMKLFEWKLFIFGFLFLLTNKLINPLFPILNFAYQVTLVFSSILLLVHYRGRILKLQEDFFKCLNFFVIHAIIGYGIYLIVPQLFEKQIGLNRSFFYLFYVSQTYFGGVLRNTGLFWEPGVFQLVANLFLFYTIKWRKGALYLLMGFLAVLSSFSTMGLFLLGVNFLYYLILNWGLRIKFIVASFFLLLILSISLPVVINNFTHKVSMSNTSGLIRLRDLYVGIELIKDKPFIGHGKFDSHTYLVKNDYVTSIEADLFTTEFRAASGEMAGGFTNGLLAFVSYYGIPVSFLLYYFFFKNFFIEGKRFEKVFFSFIPLFSMVTEPITYTSLFLLFPFSYLILKR
jgi:hypothetical protein